MRGFLSIVMFIFKFVYYPPNAISLDFFYCVAFILLFLLNTFVGAFFSSMSTRGADYR